MKKIFLFICLFLLSCCESRHKKINDIHEGTFLGYINEKSKIIKLDICNFDDWNDFYNSNGLNVVQDSFGVSKYKIQLCEILDDGTFVQKYDFYNLKEAEECQKEEYYWYIDDNKSTFKPITSKGYTTIYYDAYYLIDYFNSEGKFEFSAKLYTEEKFNDIYKSS